MPYMPASDYQNFPRVEIVLPCPVATRTMAKVLGPSSRVPRMEALRYHKPTPATPLTNPIEVVCISDTHNQINIPDGDILIHAGDLT